MKVPHSRRPVRMTRECCIHEAIHSRKMEGIHTGTVARSAAPAQTVSRDSSAQAHRSR